MQGNSGSVGIFCQELQNIRGCDIKTPTDPNPRAHSGSGGIELEGQGVIDPPAGCHNAYLSWAQRSNTRDKTGKKLFSRPEESGSVRPQ
ncbi:hypothetical protein GCM10011359_29400 [Nesterenkonia alkaliphila]|nr:hypothetical protein GCM10011359_29400 [Nesterenkonia alkaliphila]